MTSLGLSDAAHAALAIVLGALYIGTPLGKTALPWLGLVLTAVLVRVLVRWEIRRRPRAESLRVLRLAVLLVAVAWGLGPAIALAEAPFDQFALVVVVFAGIVAGVSGSLLFDRPSFYTLMVVLSAGLLGGLLVREPARVHAVTGLLVVLFGVVIAFRFERGHATQRDLIVNALRLRDQERASVREREYLSALLGSAPTAIATVDGDGVIRDVNPAFERLFGYSTEETIGRPLDDLVVPDGARTEAREFADRVLGGSGTLVVEAERRRKDGQPIPVRISAGLVRDVDPPTIFVLYDDITQMRRAQDALREAERAYRELVESASDLVWKVDRDGRWEFLNDAAREVYGAEPEALIGRPFADQVDPAHRSRDLERFGGVLRGAELSDYETVHRRVDGESRHLSFAARPVRDLDGRIVGAQGTARDVTARAEARAALEDAREAAERMAALRSSFVANMSHEIRTPLNGILGLVELLLDTELTPDQRRSVELIRTSGDALMTVINDVLDFSKIEAGRMELEEVGFDLPGMVESTARLLAVRAASRGLEVLVDVAPDVPRSVVGDPGRLRQILTNLMGNAIKFTREGEVVVAVTREAGDGPVPIRFSVRDTGIGIPPDRLEAIFEEFTQADLSTTREFGGTGLGLALCRRLVTMMQGQIHVRSTVGKGSEFWFTAPLQLRDIEAGAGPSTPRIPVGGRALVIDDSVANRRIVREILRQVGMHVDEAEDSATGLARIRGAQTERDYDVVILDGHMPGRDGFALAAEVRADPALAHTRLIMLTSAANRGDGQRCRELGIDGYLTKPVVRVEFLEAVAAVVGARAARPPDALVTRHSMKENRQRLRLLLAEDNPVNQHVARALLERRGHQVEVVGNGQLAVDAMRADRYDVVLMDLQMPVLDGITATQRIREIPGCETVPIIALTAHALVEDRDRCLAAGMNACVVKPFRPHDLFAEVEGWGTPQPQPPAPVPEQVVDLVGLRRALREAGAEDVVGELIRTFLDDCPGRLTAIEAGLAANDATAVERAAHAYKSAAGAIRAGGLADLLGRLEAAGRERAVEHARPLVADVRRAHDDVVRELRAEVARVTDLPRAHWLVALASDLHVPAETLRARVAETPVLEAWSAAAADAGITEADLARVVADHFRLDAADLDAAEARTLKLVPEAVARRYQVFPLRETDRNLVVATSDPTNLELEQVISFASGRRTVFEIAPPAAIAQAIEAHYSPERMLENLLQAVDDEDVERVRLVDESAADAVAAGEAQAAPVVKLANLILRAAVEQGASDIHVEPGRRGGLVRFRVDGVMREYMPLPMQALNRVVSRIKILGGLDIADRLRPQDGRARIRVEERLYDLRISTVPTRDSEKAVIRVLDPESSLGLDDLQLPAHELGRLRRVLGCRDGIVLVTGPTGSGKTTTLYAALHELATGEVNIMTVEDPVEYELPGITQIQVEPKRGVTFASALRAILRQDPDVILVGEIRDLETAEIAVQAALTGHLVLATLHANDAAGAVTRLLDLGLDRGIVADALRGALAQRLARRVCTECATAVTDGAAAAGAAELVRRYGVTPTVRASGCHRCLGSGYRGRIAVLELATVTDGLRALIARAAPTAELLRAAVAGGMRPMRETSLDRVRDGITTLEEIDRVLGDAGEGQPLERGDVPHVLLIDDDGVVRSLARSLLEKHGCHVAEAADGAAGLARLTGGESFDLVVLDLDMPRLGGREVLGRVRAEVTTAALPVIVLTGSDDQDLEVALMEEGADDYIRKPLEPARFVARVKGALRRAASG